MIKKKDWTDNEILQFRRDWRSDVPVPDMMQKFGVKEDVIYKFAKKLRLASRKANHTPARERA